MRVLFIARASLYTNRGGDTVQLQKTAEYLGRLGVDVDIRLTTDKMDYSGYALIHFFNLFRPADILRHIRSSARPYVVTPIYVDYSEADRRTRKGPARLLLRLFPPEAIEYAKVVARWLLNGEKIGSAAFLWYGQRRSMRYILEHAGMLLPNSSSEVRRLQERFSIQRPYRVIPNAVDPALFRPPAEAPVRDNRLVLCVARIEGIKNQLNLIKAINGSAFRLILVGAPAVNQRGYYEECRRIAGPAVSFAGAVPQEELVGYYCRAAIHVLPSFFETTGLSSLEAAAMGCAVVITDKGDTREYFGDQASYCDPASPASILRALEEAAERGPSAGLQEKIRKQYTWTETAARTLEAYQAALNGASGQ
ncbi:MAG TPA: glycosyltransferase family 4 protein [Puia sp.]|nr:glycosyltransferase family 4 protein [Puia sp.]